jgi:hypothetical protein
MTSRLSVPIASCAIIFLCGPAIAGAPCAACSSVPACILACPQGDVADTIVVQNAWGNPSTGYAVVLSFDQCPGFSLCPSSPPMSYTILSPTSIQVITDIQGRAIFALQAIGSCTGAVRIAVLIRNTQLMLTDGTNHPLSSLVSVDQDGNGIVTSADQQILAAHGATDTLGDLNCDGTHNAADMAVLMAHMGHQCPTSAVPAHGATWGSVKVRYH